MTSLEVYRGVANTWECDVMGHLNVQFYIGKLSEGMGHLRLAIGLTPERIATTGCNFVVGEALIRYRQELRAGDPLHIVLTVTGVGEKTMDLTADVIRSADGKLSARFENRAICFDMAARKAMPWPPDVRDRIAALASEPPSPLRPPTTGGPTEPPPGVETRPPLLTARSAVAAWECDELGHFSARFYMDRISHAVNHLAEQIGLGQAERQRRNVGTAALEYRIRFLRELKAGQAVSVYSGILGLGEKTFRYGHVMREDASGQVCATFDSVGCVFDMAARKAVPFPDDLRQRARALFIDWPPA